MNAPTRLGACIGQPATLEPHELDVVCSVCHRRRGDHWGQSGAYCPSGSSYTKRSTFVPSSVSQDQTRERMLADAMVHARGLGILPVYRTIRDGDGRVLRFELANEAEILGVWNEVLP